MYLLYLHKRPCEAKVHIYVTVVSLSLSLHTRGGGETGCPVRVTLIRVDTSGLGSASMLSVMLGKTRAHRMEVRLLRHSSASLFHLNPWKGQRDRLRDGHGIRNRRACHANSRNIVTVLICAKR